MEQDSFQQAEDEVIDSDHGDLVDLEQSQPIVDITFEKNHEPTLEDP